MVQQDTQKVSAFTIRMNKVKTYFSKPQNVILLLFGIILTITTVAPIVAIVRDTFTIHPGTIDANLEKKASGRTSGFTVMNYTDLFTSKLAKKNLWTPLLNTVYLAVGTCVVSILFGSVYLPAGSVRSETRGAALLPGSAVLRSFILPGLLRSPRVFL